MAKQYRPKATTFHAMKYIKNTSKVDLLREFKDVNLLDQNDLFIRVKDNNTVFWSEPLDRWIPLEVNEYLVKDTTGFTKSSAEAFENVYEEVK